MSTKSKNRLIGLVRERTARFLKTRGRRPRILITRIDPMASDREVKLKATALADLGFDVDINTSAQLPVAIARLALENDVHAVGIPGLCDDDHQLAAELVAAFNTEGAKKVVLAAWTHDTPAGSSGFISAELGSILMFPIDAETTACANRILDALEQKR